MGIKPLYTIIRKNFKILGRSKLSTIAIILAPFLIILLAGYAFNSSGVSGIVIGTYSNSYSNLTEEILTSFQDQNFALNKYSSEKECIDSVKLSKTQICVIFPEDLTEYGSSNEIYFYVDYSRVNLAYSLLNEIEDKVNSKSSSIGITFAQDVVDSLVLVKNSLPNQKSSVKNSIEGLNEISEKADSLVVSDFENIIDSLTKIKSLINDSEAKIKIDQLIDSLTELKTKFSEDANFINSKTSESMELLNQVSSDLNNLILSINSTNILEAEKIVSPLRTKIQSINTDSNNRLYLLPSILSLLALFGGVLLASTFVLKERKTKAYFRNFITPTKDFTFFVGNYLTCMIILILQFIIVLAGINWILNIEILSILPRLSLILFLSLTVFTFFGIFIGYLFKSEETTIFSAVLIAALMMFFSNTILPIETISSGFKKIAMFNPLVVCDSALKKVMLFNLEYTSFSLELSFLVGFFIIFAVLGFIGLKLTKRML